jgi:hypothetical protein
MPDAVREANFEARRDGNRALDGGKRGGSAARIRFFDRFHRI